MSHDIGVGSILECISNKQNEQLAIDHAKLTVGALYCVDELVHAENVVQEDLPCSVDGCIGPFLILRSKGHSKLIRIAYCPSQFKPFGGTPEEVEKQQREFA